MRRLRRQEPRRRRPRLSAKLLLNTPSFSNAEHKHLLRYNITKLFAFTKGNSGINEGDQIKEPANKIYRDCRPKRRIVDPNRPATPLRSVTRYNSIQFSAFFGLRDHIATPRSEKPGLNPSNKTEEDHQIRWFDFLTVSLHFSHFFSSAIDAASP